MISLEKHISSHIFEVIPSTNPPNVIGAEVESNHTSTPNKKFPNRGMCKKSDR